MGWKCGGRRKRYPRLVPIKGGPFVMVDPLVTGGVGPKRRIMRRRVRRWLARIGVERARRAVGSDTLAALLRFARWETRHD